jgi:phage terminase small subunit
MKGRRPQPTILKLVRGDTNAGRFKDDAPKVNDLPRLPPGVVLSEKERAMWDWLMEHVVMPGVHGTSDGAAFVKICRLWVRVMDADAKIEEFGLLMKNPTTQKPELQPYTRLSRDLWHHLGNALAEVGATPTGRVRLAGPMKGGGMGDPTSWDDIK